MEEVGLKLSKEIEEILEWKLLPDDVHDVIEVDLTTAHVDLPYVLPVPMRNLSVTRADDEFKFKVDYINTKPITVRRGTTPVWRDRIFRILYITNSASTVPDAKATIVVSGRIPTPAVLKRIPPITIRKIPTPKFREVIPPL